MNIILLTIDALRADRTSLYGYDRPTTPNLERLAENAIVCEYAFSLGPFTQSAAIQLLTSSRPFSHGGYNNGAFNKPATVFRQFHDAGYHTTALSTLHWVNRYYGYGDGIDDERQLFVINTLLGVSVIEMRVMLVQYLKGEVSDRDFNNLFVEIIHRLHRNVDEYCDIFIKRESEFRKAYADSLLVNAGYDYRKIKKVMARHIALYQRDPLAYIRHYLKAVPAAHEWIARDWSRCRKPGTYLERGLFTIGNTLLGLFNPRLAYSRKNRFKSYVDAAELSDSVIAEFQAQDSTTPFFIWAHYMDIHQPYVSGRGRRWYRETPRHLRAVGHPDDIDPALTFREYRPTDPEIQSKYSMLYDAAVHSVDQEIGRIVDAVDRSGRGQETLIAVCADHGEELGDHGDLGHFFLPFEHNIRVPMLFRLGGSQPRRVNSLVDLTDVAPTLASLSGIAAHPGWEGASVLSDEVKDRDAVILEMFYGGACDFENRYLYMAVRTRTHKFFWKEHKDAADSFSHDGPELYDLVADPMENHNIYRSDHKVVEELSGKIARRLAEIPEISTQRIIDAFGPIGAAAVREKRDGT